MLSAVTGDLTVSGHLPAVVDVKADTGTPEICQ